MENYYRNFYPYRFYSPFNFRAYPYGKGRYSQNNYYKKEENSNNVNSYKENPDNLGSSRQNNEYSTKNEDRSKPVFEIFGIKLFFDDILLISLIFFLYSEGVKDQSLFISLILLLLS